MKKLIFPFLLILISCSNNGKYVYSGVFTAEDYLLKSQVAGKVISFSYDEGENVTYGDTLIHIDDRELKLMIVSMEYKISNLKEQIKDAKEDLDESEELYKASAIPEKTYEMMRRKLRTMEMEFKSLEASLESKKESIKNFYIISPSDGYISEKFIKEGETVIPGAPLVEVIDPSKLYLNIYIPEDVLPIISLNQDIKIKIDAFPEKHFNGKVVFISGEAEFTPKNIQTKEDRTLLVYRVKIKIENPEGLIKPGIYGDAYIK